MSFLLDTNIVSETRKRRGNAAVKSWIASVHPEDLYLSVLVVGEVRRGIEQLRRRNAEEARVLEAWLASLRRDYAGRLLPVDGDVAEMWGRLNVPNTLPIIDSYLAATALVHGLTLVTRNVADVQRTGVPILNPFEWTGKILSRDVTEQG